MYSNNKFPPHAPSLQGLRVLLVDNHADSCDLMAQMLQPYGVELQTAASAQQALEIFGQWQPDAIVSEIALPKEDGFALIRKVRILKQRGKTVLAIAVTAYATEKIRQRALCAGFDLCFAKPLHFDEFVAVLTCLAVCQQSSTRSGMSWKWQSKL